MNNEVIKLLADLLRQREDSESPIDWNLIENDYGELEEIMKKSLSNEKLFADLDDEIQKIFSEMLDCIDELDDEITGYEVEEDGESREENEEERNERLSDRIETLRTDLDDVIELLKNILPHSKSIFNYDVQMNQRTDAALEASRRVREFQSNEEMFKKIHGDDEYEIELARLKKMREEVLNRNTP